MALKLPRLQRQVPVTEPALTPTTEFHQWWDKTAGTVEGAVDDIVAMLVRLGLVEVTADGALALSTSAINPGGTIKDSKVLTTSIIAEGVTDRYLDQLGAAIVLPDTVETDVLVLAVTKTILESDMDIDIALRLSSNEDVRGDMKLYRDGAEIDSFSPFLNGSGGTYRTVITLPYTDVGLAPGSYTYKITFTRNGGASTLTADENSVMRIKEIKR